MYDPCKKSGGLIGCPADAAEKVKELADYICNNNGGSGAVREFIEWLIKNDIYIATEGVKKVIMNMISNERSKDIQKADYNYGIDLFRMGYNTIGY